MNVNKILIGTNSTDFTLHGSQIQFDHRADQPFKNLRELAEAAEEILEYLPKSGKSDRLRLLVADVLGYHVDELSGVKHSLEEMRKDLAA